MLFSYSSVSQIAHRAGSLSESLFILIAFMTPWHHVTYSLGYCLSPRKNVSSMRVKNLWAVIVSGI